MLNFFLAEFVYYSSVKKEKLIQNVLKHHIGANLFEAKNSPFRHARKKLQHILKLKRAGKSLKAKRSRVFKLNIFIIIRQFPSRPCSLS